MSLWSRSWNESQKSLECRFNATAWNCRNWFGTFKMMNGLKSIKRDIQMISHNIWLVMHIFYAKLVSYRYAKLCITKAGQYFDTFLIPRTVSRHLYINSILNFLSNFGIYKAVIFLKVCLFLFWKKKWMEV